ncbi:MAG TPA: hypothetical protein VEG60_21395 [Candidatus Binatia bacterium]|nr:hypothetical protein [Candidatus Binatia bacterium]
MFCTPMPIGDRQTCGGIFFAKADPDGKTFRNIVNDHGQQQQPDSTQRNWWTFGAAQAVQMRNQQIGAVEERNTQYGSENCRRNAAETKCRNEQAKHSGRDHDPGGSPSMASDKRSEGALTKSAGSAPKPVARPAPKLARSAVAT